MTYIQALQSVNALLNESYKSLLVIKNKASVMEIKDTYSKHPVFNPAQQNMISLREINKLMSILVNLEE